MVIEKRAIKSLAVLCLTIFMMFFASCEVNNGDTQTVTIKGAVVEEVERQTFKMPSEEEMIASGKLPGGMEGEPGGAPGGAGRPPGAGGPTEPGGGAALTPAIYINDGKYIAAESKKDVVTGGKITDAYASGIKISADQGNIGGVYVKGTESEYTLADAEIELSGDGGELGGAGSGAASDERSTLILRNVDITTSGVSKSATSATNYSTLKVYNSTLTAHGVPFDQSDISPPAALEIKGNSRTHVTMSNSYSYFYYSTIIADGWAALSTDGSMGFVYLEANNCEVKTVNSGYGTYADGCCHNYFNYCDFDVASMATIIAGEADCTFRNTKARCGTYFAMIHCVMGLPIEVGTLNVTGGEIECKSPVVIVKSQNAVINFDGVKVTSEDGILVKSIVNDDLDATKTNGQKVYGIHTTFKGMDVSGDIIHEDTDRDMYVNLDSTTLKGAIKDAIIMFDGTSKWIATSDSNVTITGSIDVAQIDAPAGITINAVAGVEGTFILRSGGTLKMAN